MLNLFFLSLTPGITKWLEGWKKKNWMKSSGEEVVNKEDLQELDEKLEGINVKWVSLSRRNWEAKRELYHDI